ncbi:hypothetical protein K469DRAFT_708001 [Zopfia rhizophila CBS 207.26]|uniref:Gag1-like clamp domain-containing protein n=1 Tax=Zopfia rhizophila CBS 207.26 TaxID=1314779 RepID=A0A6A6DZW8_9PEZI|nr:hypothetical protein K469DRAFT_708001 [Zopfia rhizophila CBS 207.26]
MENNQTAARAARRFLTDRVRDDWDWPNSPPYWSASDEEVQGVSQFRERYYGTTDSSEAETEGDANVDPYKFDSPDSIGTAIESKVESRKRKRRTVLESEMAWNEGLTCFVRRRDVWTGAASVKKYGTNRQGSATEGYHSSTSDTTMPSEASSSNGAPLVPSNVQDLDCLIPLAPPLLPNNATRDSITPKAYTDIYNKIVMSSRTPSVPINLSDMTRALVQGWKDNGEWPPKAGPLDPLAGRKRAALLGGKMDKGDIHGEGPFLAHHPHMKKGMESMKRIFHLNGYHPHSSEHGTNG